ncbi:hypothetical protein [Yoonia sp. 208BN28-4]|uniref:hypothetical protein n=1 Tax=Yoonia sp. 208BN28-4 TaxID=3126505 RepID=UPI0030982519
MLTSLTLAGCDALSGMTRSVFSERPAGAEPVDVLALRAALVEQYPTADTFAALDPNGRGLVLGLDGSASFLAPVGSVQPRVETTIAGFEDNTMCLAEAGGWSGVCVDLFQTPDGSYFCEGTYGDGRALDFPCILRPYLDG